MEHTAQPICKGQNGRHYFALLCWQGSETQQIRISGALIWGVGLCRRLACKGVKPSPHPFPLWSVVHTYSAQSWRTSQPPKPASLRGMRAGHLTDIPHTGPPPLSVQALEKDRREQNRVMVGTWDASASDAHWLKGIARDL